MQRAHELAEARALAAASKTEQQQLEGIEQQIIHGPSSTVYQLRERQRQLQEEMAQHVDPLRGITEAVAARSTAFMKAREEEQFLKKTEDEIMGRRPRPSSVLSKMSPGMEEPLTHRIENDKVKVFRLLHGRMPTTKEMREWITKK